MGRFKDGLAQFATSRIQPSHKATDPTLDFSDLLRQPVSGQKHVITAGVKHLHKHKALLFVGQIGTGKTMVSMSMVHKHAAGATYHAIVFCPGQLINKWKREIETTLRGVDVVIIESWEQLATIARRGWYGKAYGKANGRKGWWKWGHSGTPIRTHHRKAHTTLARPTWFIISRDRCKLGWTNEQAVFTRRELPCCSHCFHPVVADDIKCKMCREVLRTATRGRMKRDRCSPAWFISRKMRGFFDYLIVDEVHEEKAIDSLQAVAVGKLAAACRKVIALTGTLVGGQAEHIRPLLYRLVPSVLIRAGFQWNQMSRFNERYGRHQVQGRRKKKIPGIMPNLFGECLMGHTVFLSLDEVASDLPDRAECEIGVKMDPAMAEEYRRCSEIIVDELREMFYRSNRKGLGKMLSFLMNWPDSPWAWDTIEGVTESGEPYDIVTPAKLQYAITPKEQELARLIAEQKRRGRKCWVYVQSTGEINLLHRLRDLLTQRGYRVSVLENVPPEKREEWIAKHAHKCDVILSHPILVQTGLDFFAKDRSYNFPTLIFFQTGYNAYQTRQAGGRSWRIGQWLVCEVYYLHYEGTAQSRNLVHMAEKISASLSLEGKFSSEGLLAMLGNDQESGELALAKSLIRNTPINMARAWERISTTRFGSGRDFFEEW